MGQHTSIAIDSNDKVHISYYDATNLKTKYATDASGSWVVTALTDSNDLGGGGYGWFTSIAIDSNDKVHISYLWWTWSFSIRYVTNSGGAWTYEDTVPNTESVVLSVLTMALDSNDKAHIALTCGTSGSADSCYATNSGGS